MLKSVSPVEQISIHTMKTTHYRKTVFEIQWVLLRILNRNQIPLLLTSTGVYILRVIFYVGVL